jgi:hypothetical protein
LYDVIQAHVPKSREQSVAITNLEQVSMWANKGIVFNQSDEILPKVQGLAVSIARICHDANRAYCISLGDFSQPDWDAAPEWQKESAILGVTTIFENPCMTPEDSHRGWMEHKAAEGWVYGEVKDAEAKTHPCMVEYDQLPAEQRRKDRIFHSIVKSFID